MGYLYDGYGIDCIRQRVIQSYLPPLVEQGDHGKTLNGNATSMLALGFSSVTHRWHGDPNLLFHFLFLFWRFKIMASVLERADMYCSLASYKALSYEQQRVLFDLRNHLCMTEKSAQALRAVLQIHTKKFTL